MTLTHISGGGGGPIPVDFDPAQQLAVRIALTKTAPVVWIQGPPCLRPFRQCLQYPQGLRRYQCRARQQSRP